MDTSIYFLCVKKHFSNQRPMRGRWGRVYHCLEYQSVEEADLAFDKFLMDAPYSYKRYESTIVPISKYWPKAAREHVVKHKLTSTVIVDIRDVE